MPDHTSGRASGSGDRPRASCRRPDVPRRVLGRPLPTVERSALMNADLVVAADPLRHNRLPDAVPANRPPAVGVPDRFAAREVMRIGARYGHSPPERSGSCSTPEVRCDCRRCAPSSSGSFAGRSLRRTSATTAGSQVRGRRRGRTRTERGSWWCSRWSARHRCTRGDPPPGSSPPRMRLRIPDAQGSVVIGRSRSARRRGRSWCAGSPDRPWA